ncbi:Transposase IS200 like protein [Botrimarina colliarenosi]|uniref:Transposase IS200 like protein n=1 Tax=Botrimarina colliarenosi TaxID=2528001 RepID=A0A5C6AC90_9BACT|nr:transposase [Botrimarina colliarenosi]TWT96755.1 Transposase IS200 like protein [Botrimarina colliarenosi]
MPNYRRCFVEGGTYFFTVKTEANHPIFASDAQATLLGVVMREARERWPFETVASVLLPDHFHAIWTLPAGDSDYSKRWAWIKKEFTKRHLKAGGAEQPVSQSRQENRRRGIWQRRFWEHLVEGETELEAYVAYIHYNPVKHGYAAAPGEWRWTTFHRWVEKGTYSPDWGRTETPPSIAKIDGGE